MKRLLRIVRVTFIDLTLGGLAAWSVWVQLAYRAPSRYATVLLAGIAVACIGLTIAFWLHAVFRGAGARDKLLSPIALGLSSAARHHAHASVTVENSQGYFVLMI